ncbi:uncharacterized protein F5147DRAFT_748558 [Suillus discolor]|uniref:DUF6830 domain-containing protein n=1 Tax=Suillus discolor TaxID=1912936 RepID=A0A9P7ET08_9AGAM|nr:uncharacterized protein F5147DRAFT_748558 [Suillus discolor]KAG2087116.1 hypothetical protein F5147DRAFT_748558 [Suillus discolor]
MAFQCPSCGKGGFKDDVAVARHMSQPRSGCSTWLQDLICSRSEGYTFLDLFNSDENSKHRATNPYYPFSGQKDWEVGSWLLHSGLSMGKIDSFLSLDMIKTLPLSFHSAKELRGRAEMLPSGPCWMSQVVPTAHPTKSPIVLYWRDPLDCISGLLNHPAFHDHLDFTPRRVYSTAQRLCHVYSEWMTSDDAWNMQSALPRGATLLGTILSSDKTNISTMTDDRSSSNAFVLTALLPVPKFIHRKKRMRGVLEDRLIHECLDIVLRPLKLAAHEGVMLSDPVGHTTTLSQLDIARSKADPNDIEAFFREAQKFRLNGVNAPFWMDWVLSDPSHFLTPEFLHLIHREFYDHDASGLFIDFRFSVLQAVTGFRHFHGGISKLKQVTGRTQHDIQRSIIAVSADAIPSAVMTAVRALMDFRYLIQSPVIDDILLARISTALDHFHANKDAIIEGGFRRGQRGRLMQSIVPSIRNIRVSLQWTADTTEHAHITEIKSPAHLSNNNNYDPQICRHLDRADKCRHFDLAMSLLDNVPDSGQQDPDDDEKDENVDFDVDDDCNIPADLLTTMKYPGHSRPITNYFGIAKVLQHREVGTVPVPLRSFVVKHTAFHLTYDPSIRNISVDDAAIKFAIADFLRREATHGRDHIHTIGGARRAGPTASLPFDKLQVWFKLWVQDTNFHHASIIRPAQTLNCAPPSDPWTCGQYDTVIINNEAGYLWPEDGLRGHTIGQIRLIMRAIGKSGTNWSWKDHFLVYVHHFDIVSQSSGADDREPMKRSNGTWVGDVIPVTQLRAPVNLVPCFSASADNRLTPYNSMEHASQFWLNRYWDKNVYFPLSM